MKNRIILAIATVLILAIGLMAGHHNLEEAYVIYLSGSNYDNYIALPYSNTISPQNAAGLRNSIIAAGGTDVNVYNWGGSSWQRYKGGGGGQTLFPLSPGVGYRVSISNSGYIPWTVDGSHDPSVSISLSANARKLVSIPFDSPSYSASLLSNEIVAAGGTGVCVYQWTGSAWQKWSGGGLGQLDFGIESGNSYMVKSTSDVAAWYPASN